MIIKKQKMSSAAVLVLVAGILVLIVMFYNGYGKYVERIEQVSRWGFYDLIPDSYLSYLASDGGSWIAFIIGVGLIVVSVRLPKKTVEIPVVIPTAEQEIQKKQSRADELIKYKELLDSGVLTQEEFDAKKKEVLERST